MKNLKDFLTGVTNFWSTRNQPDFDLPNASDQPSYDLTGLYQLAEGNPVYISQLLELFLQNTEQGLQEIQAACQLEQWNQSSELAHRIIPGCKHLHLDNLVQLLQQIEVRSSSTIDPKLLNRLASLALESFYRVQELIEQEIKELNELPSPIKQ